MSVRGPFGLGPHRAGKPANGYLADLVVLSGDIEALPVDRIDTLDVAYTLCDDEVVYRKAEH